jgi:hypothetical protein
MFSSPLNALRQWTRKRQSKDAREQSRTELHLYAFCSTPFVMRCLSGRDLYHNSPAAWKIIASVCELEK